MQTQFSEQMVTEFEALDLDSEIYALGDFDINLLLETDTFSISQMTTKKFDKGLLPEKNFAKCMT